MGSEMCIRDRIKHDRIVKLYDVYRNEVQGELCLVLEYVSGGNLYDKLKRYGKFQEEVVKKYVIDIVDALKYLHERDEPILHRDLKPENIMLDG